MSRRSRGSVLMLAVALGACGGPTDLDGETPEVVVPPPTAAEVAPAADVPEPVVGPDGALLESDQRAFGLVLPRGLETVVEEDRRHVYRTRSRTALVLSYFGPRLETAIVERSDRGAATYREARPTGVRTGPRMDVTISPTSGDYPTRIELALEPEEALGEPSEEDTRRRLEALLREGE